jgi:tellurite resistance protein TerB
LKIVEKLRIETERYWDSPFLKAAMAVCALTLLSDGKVSVSKRYRADAIINTMDRLRVHNPHKAVDIMDNYIAALRTNPGKAEDVLQGKILRCADDYRMSQTLLRIAYLVITAGDEVNEAERFAFNRICATLSVNSEEIWAKMRENG